MILPPPLTHSKQQFGHFPKVYIKKIIAETFSTGFDGNNLGHR